MKHFLLVLFFITCSSGSTKSFVEYAVSAGKYLIVSKSISVSSGDTLIVPEGSYVLFDSLCGITVYSGGFLSSIGTKKQPVYLTSILDSSGTASPYDWNGIDIEKGAFAHFAYSFIAYSTFGVTASDSFCVRLDSCIFSSNGQWHFSLSGVVSEVVSLHPFSYLSRSNFVVSQPVLVDTISSKSISIPAAPSGNRSLRARNFILGGVGVSLFAAGSASLYKAHRYHSKYNSYLPGNSSFDASTPSTRQKHFDKLRKKYKSFSAIGWSCIGLAAADCAFLAVTFKF